MPKYSPSSLRCVNGCLKHHTLAEDNGCLKHHTLAEDNGCLKHHTLAEDNGCLKHHTLAEDNGCRVLGKVLLTDFMIHYERASLTN